MPDCRPEHGTPISLDKLRSLSVLGRRTRPQVREGRQHPETGRPWKTTADEAGTVTEHNVKHDRVDVVARVETVHAVRDPDTGRITNVS